MSEHPRRIVVSGLTKAFGAVTAVDDLAFTAEPGAVTGVLGPNGAGKTTTLRILLGLVAPDAGSATIGGKTYRDLAAPADVVGAALDATAFHPMRTGRNHLRILCTVNGYPSQRADEVLALVDLTAAARRPVGGYSLGMRQRLALATALLGDPGVVVLDEPANGLDPAGIVWMRRLLHGLAEDGCTVLVSSHILTEMQQLVDAVVIMHQGRLLQQGSLADLAVAEGEVVSVRTPEPDRLAAVLSPARTERVGSDHLRIVGLTPAEVGRRAFHHGVEMHWLASEHTSLERTFFALTLTDGASAGGDRSAEAG